MLWAGGFQNREGRNRQLITQIRVQRRQQSAVESEFVANPWDVLEKDFFPVPLIMFAKSDPLQAFGRVPSGMEGARGRIALASAPQ